MATKKLPKESTDDLRAQTTIGEADIAKCKQMVAAMRGPVKYQDGKDVKTVRAERVRLLWESDTQ